MGSLLFQIVQQDILFIKPNIYDFLLGGEFGSELQA
jgi:hypothetical protein